MPPQKTMTQEQVRAIMAEFAGTKVSQKIKAVGDVSAGRYGKRHVPGEMNKTEERYAEILESKKRLGEILEWFFEPCSWKYAKDARFTADFMVLHCSGKLEFIDVKGKGPQNEAADCRAKACADRYWMFTFSQIKHDASGGWVRRVF